MARKLAIAAVMLSGCLVLALAVGALLGAVKPISLSIGGVASDKATAAVVASKSGASAASAIESDFKANEDLAESAPQQQVVAGWATKDGLQALLRQSDVIAQQNADLSMQLADGTNALAAGVNGLVSLLTVIALTAVAGCLLLLGLALGVLWRRTPAEPVSASIETEPAAATAE